MKLTKKELQSVLAFSGVLFLLFSLLLAAALLPLAANWKTDGYIESNGYCLRLEYITRGGKSTTEFACFYLDNNVCMEATLDSLQRAGFDEALFSSHLSEPMTFQYVAFEHPFTGSHQLSNICLNGQMLLNEEIMQAVVDESIFSTLFVFCSFLCWVST